MVASRQILRLVIISQYLLRLYLIFPLSSEIVKANGVMMEKAWAGAAYNLMLYMLASHVRNFCFSLIECVSFYLSITVGFITNCYSDSQRS